MPKLLQLVIYKCLDCPYCEKSEQGGNYCAAPNRFIKLANPTEIPEDCPLPTINENS